MGIFGIFGKNPKNAHIVRQSTPPECVSKYCFCIHLVAISIGYVVVYSIFSVGASLEEKFAKQNEGDTRRKNFSEKALIVGRQF